MEDERHLDDLKIYICSKLSGHLVNENDLDGATEMLFKKSEGSFVYMASMVASFAGEKKWTIAELKGLPDGLDGVYCANFARILEPKQEAVPYNVGKVS